MKKGVAVLLMSFVFILGFIQFISSSTTITNSQITTTGTLEVGTTTNGDKFVLAGGNFVHNAGHFVEVGCIKDDAVSGGTASFFDGGRDVFVQGSMSI